MNPRLMVLPSADQQHIRVVSVPEDYEAHEAFRHVTGLIARVQESGSGHTWDDVAEALESDGFTPVEFMLGPAWD